MTYSSKNSTHPFEVSVIVCHHRGDFIHRFVDSVKKSVGVKYEIIVITSDDTLALKGISGCRVLSGDPYPAAKRNTGARLSKGEYLAFFDDDVEINQDCLLRMKDFLDRVSSCGMVFGKLYNMERRNRFDEAGGFLTRTGFIWSRAGQNDVDTGQYDRHETILAGKSASCMIREKLFFKVGGFDEEFEILGEETDLAWRVWLYGSKVYFVPHAVGYHAFGTKFKPAKDYYTSKRVNFNGCRNYLTLLLKNLGTKNLLKILPLHALIWFFAGTAMIMTAKFSQGMNVLRGLCYVLKNLRAILKKRKYVQDKRTITDKELFPFIYQNPPKGYCRQRFFRYLRTNLHG